MRFLGLVFAIYLSALAFSSQAAPWVNTDDRYLRSSLKILADGGYLRVPINTYPLMWQPILSDLTTIDTASMDSSQLFAYLRVMSAADFAKQSSIKSISLATSSDVVDNSGFGQSYQHMAEITLGTEKHGLNWAVGVKKTFSDNSHYENTYQVNNSWDGSYAAYMRGNWVLSAAQQQLWWGPAYDSSVNFSNGNRPLKALQLSRLDSNEPLMSGLEPLGAVNIQLLFAEQPGSALLRHARVLAGRVNIRPVKKLELGMSGSQLHTVKNIIPLEEQQNTGLSYNFPASRITSISIDGRYSINASMAAYGELARSSGHYGWLIGSEYSSASQTKQTLLVAEYKQVADAMPYWQELQHENPYGQVGKRWLVAVERHYRTGKSFYLNINQAHYSQNSLLVAHIPLTKRGEINLGYQTPLFSGLLTLDGQLSHDKTIAGNTEFNQSVGVRWEHRW